MESYAAQALRECNDGANVIRQGGINGRPFWNINASQFLYVPAFLFPIIPGAKEYIFSAVDSTGKTHSFSADIPTAPLTPIWKDLAVGLVELKVEAIHKNGRAYLAGARTFCKMAAFPGRDALPPRACSYKECALKAFRYVLNSPTTRYWLEHGVPKPDYYHYVYPSKMISSIIWAMATYAQLEPENAGEALRLAKNAADYLLSITYGEDSLLAGLPPTFSFKGLVKEIVDETAAAADGRQGNVMMFYPATVGYAYLRLEQATGDTKYFEAAARIAEHYKKTVLPNGSWYLLVSEKTGKQQSENCCSSFAVLDFLHNFYLRTGDETYRRLEQNYFAYIWKMRFENYSWEAQFEDSLLSSNYENLSHYDANSMLDYIVNNMADDPAMLKEAEELMRFVEDQFVTWVDFAEWNPDRDPKEQWYSPAAMEQYKWHVPIDGSTCTVMNAFLNMYKATGKKLYLEKACALGDSITRRQNPETGVVPTHWITTDCSTVLKNFWLNCHVSTAFRMLALAEAMGEL